MRVQYSKVVVLPNNEHILLFFQRRLEFASPVGLRPDLASGRLASGPGLLQRVFQILAQPQAQAGGQEKVC